MLPKINQVLHMSIHSIDEEEARQEYKSRISDIGDETITMEVPIHEKTGKLKRLYSGDELSVYFITEGGMKNYFTTTVIGFKDDIVKMVVVRKPDPESITKIQRRSFLRVPAELEIAAKLTEQVRFLGMTEDVSGGGLSLTCDGTIPLKTNDTLDCWLLLSLKQQAKPDHIPFKAEVVRVKPEESGRQMVMLRFADLSDKERQKIIRYCFDRQLELRK